MTAPNISRNDWLSMRSSGIGSSDAAAACGESKVSPAEIVLQKRGIMQPADLSNIEAVNWGQVLEPIIVAKTAARKGLRLLDPVLDRAVIEREIERDGHTEVVGWIEGRQAFLRSVERPWQHAAIDGIAIDEHSGLIDIEAKNVGGYHSRDWDPENGGAPAKFDCQLAHQLAVAPNFVCGMLSALVGGNSLRVLSRRRPEMQATIESLNVLEERVWKCVEDGSMPSFDGSESHILALRSLHQKDTGETITLPEEAVLWHRELSALQTTHSEHGKRIKQLRSNIEAAMNGATFGVLPNGLGIYSNRHQTRKSYTVGESTFPVLRFYTLIK